MIDTPPRVTMGMNPPTDPLEGEIWMQLWYDASFLRDFWRVYRWGRQGWDGEFEWRELTP